MKKQKKSATKLSQENPAHHTGGGVHGAYTQPIPLLNEASKSGRHSGRAVPPTVRVGEDNYAASANADSGGEVNAQNTNVDSPLVSPVTDAKNLPRFLRGTTAVAGEPSLAHGTYGPNGEELGESPAIVAHT